MHIDLVMAQKVIFWKFKSSTLISLTFDLWHFTFNVNKFQLVLNQNGWFWSAVRYVAVGYKFPAPSRECLFNIYLKVSPQSLVEYWERNHRNETSRPLMVSPLNLEKNCIWMNMWTSGAFSKIAPGRQLARAIDFRTQQLFLDSHPELEITAVLFLRRTPHTLFPFSSPSPENSQDCGFKVELKGLCLLLALWWSYVASLTLTLCV